MQKSGIAFVFFVILQQLYEESVLNERFWVYKQTLYCQVACIGITFAGISYGYMVRMMTKAQT